MASLDLEKAFDKVLHSALYQGLREAGVAEQDLKAIESLYKDQSAHVQLDPTLRSIYFKILRGVRQGDPMSPALFACTLRKTMIELKKKWERQKYGTLIGVSDAGQGRLTFVMFADDTTLVAKSRTALKKMLKDLQVELIKLGLTLNEDKCKLQCSRPSRHRKDSLEVGSIAYPIVCRDVGFKVLGTTFTLNGSTHIELLERVAAAWRKFGSLGRLLMKRDASECQRLKLFDTTVSKTMLWCSESWKLSVAEKRALRAAQRAMLRKMIGPKRRPDEDYIDWIKRSTKDVEAKANRCGVRCWCESFLSAKWRWAGRVARTEDERWAKRCTTWRDSAWCAAKGPRPLRSRQGRHYKWEDDLRQFSTAFGWDAWRSMALDEEKWLSHEDDFIAWAWR